MWEEGRCERWAEVQNQSFIDHSLFFPRWRVCYPTDWASDCSAGGSVHINKNAPRWKHLQTSTFEFFFSSFCIKHVCPLSKAFSQSSNVEISSEPAVSLRSVTQMSAVLLCAFSNVSVQMWPHVCFKENKRELGKLKWMWSNFESSQRLDSCQSWIRSV